MTALFSRPFFHEVVVQLNTPASEVIELLAKKNILAGVALGEEYSERGDVVLVCATETKTVDDLDTFVRELGAACA